MREADLMRTIQIEASRLGWRLFRNQVGHYKLEDGTHIASGLAIGSSDLIGWKAILVAGVPVAQFVSVEVKTEHGRVEKHQQAWLDAVRGAGGIAIVARSPEDLNRLEG